MHAKRLNEDGRKGFKREIYLVESHACHKTDQLGFHFTQVSGTLHNGSDRHVVYHHV